MNEQVSAIVLKQTDYRESDVILSVLTEEYGKLSFLAAGARKITSKNAGSIIPCTKTLIQFDWHQGRSVQRLKSARAEKMYLKLRSGLDTSACAMMMAETADQMSLEDNELGTAAEEFRLFEKGLDALEEGHQADLVVSLYLADLMRIFGIEPDVDECVRCGSLSVSAISPADGGFLCPACAAKAGIPAKTAAQLKQFRLTVKAGLDHLEYAEKQTDREFSSLGYLTEMIRTHAGVKIRSYDLVQRIFGIE